MKKTMIAWATAALMLGTSASASVAISPDEIYAIEQRLNALGYLSQADNVWDDATAAAIAAFQQANDLEVTGEADENTQNLLNGGEAVTRRGYLESFAQKYAGATAYENGDYGDEIIKIQQALSRLGYFTRECDGMFGAATQAAVEKFQMANGLTVTGIADGSTQMRLLEGSPVSWERYLEDLYTDAGDSGLNVYILQKKLSRMGYFDGELSGSFGDVTGRALMDFQKNNGLEPTGVADSATWAKIYSEDAVVLKKEYALQLGDFGESVQRMQQRLMDLGYYTREITGAFGPATETAVRLFQMANGLEVTGEVEETTLERLNAENPLAIDDPTVQTQFADQLDSWDPDRFSNMAQKAYSLLGKEFSETEDALYPGYAFVQYVCVSSGLPITSPEALIALTDYRVEPGTKLESGNVVAFQTVTDNNVSILLAISIDESRVVYATADQGWVVLSYLDQMNNANVYRWGESMEAAE